MTKVAHTTEIFADNGEGYFAAHLDDGGIRIGLSWEISFNFPAGHKNYTKALGANNENVEDIFDELFSIYGESSFMVSYK